MQHSTRRVRNIRGKGMWAGSVVVLLVAAAAAGGTAAHARQVVPASTARPVTLDVQDARLEKVVQLLGMQTGLDNIVIQTLPGRSFSPVTLRLTDRPMDVVLRAVARSAGAKLEVEDGTFFLRPLSEEEVKGGGSVPARPTPAALNLENAVVAGSGAAPALAVRERRPLQTIKIPVNWMKASDLESVLKDPTGLRIRSQIFFDPDQIQNPKAQLVAPFPIQQQQPIVPGAPGDNPAATGGFSAGQRGGLGGGGGGLGGGGGQFGGGGGLGGGQLGGGGGLGGGGLGGGQGGQGQAGQLLPEGITSVLGYDLDNSLLVQFDDPAALTTFRDIIRLLDVPPKQVLIKVEFIDVGINDLNSFGIDFQIRPAGNVDLVLPGIGTGASLTLAYASGNAVALLRASLVRNSTNVIQSPIVTTVNNGIGFVQIQDLIPTLISQQVITGNGNVVTNTQPIQIPVNNLLFVQPRINGDNSITLTVQPQLSSADVAQGPGGVPLITQRTRVVGATRRIQNGETMVLGGFITRQESKSENKVPILGDLPIIGKLFQQRETRTTGTETLVFLTPTIIEDAQTGTTGAISTPPTP